MSFPVKPPTSEELAAVLASDKTIAIHYSEDAIGNRVAEIKSYADDLRRMRDQPTGVNEVESAEQLRERLRQLQRMPELPEGE
jgi:hypothetical protein